MAIRINEEGNALADQGDDAGAERAYRRAIELDPQFESAWFNLGLVFKRRHDWAESMRCNQRAAELNPRKEQPAWWNLGIAATALRDWPVARRAWTGFGIAIPDGDGPIDGNFGFAPVRIGLPEPTEVVWCRRLDPARAVIQSVPLPESGHRHGDVVLHDGEPKGEREAFGRVFSVFDELERWQPSDIPTVVVSLRCATEADATAVGKLADLAGLTYEDWTANVNMLCKACSEGRVHSQHDHDGDARWRTERRFGFAARPEAVMPLLDRWKSEGQDRENAGLEVH